MSSPTRFTLQGLVRAGASLSAAALYGLFALAHGVAFRQHPRPSLVLVVLLEAFFAIFLLARAAPVATSRAWWDWLVTAGGTLAPTLLRPAPAAADATGGEALQAAGMLLALAAALALNRSLGLVPAHRGVRTRGPYRWVRHPIYLAYTLADAGYVLSNLTARNAAVAALAFALQLLRIRGEERFLARYPEYRAYQARTRWRLVPGIY